LFGCGRGVKGHVQSRGNHWIKTGPYAGSTSIFKKLNWTVRKGGGGGGWFPHVAAAGGRKFKVRPAYKDGGKEQKPPGKREIPAE